MSVEPRRMLSVCLSVCLSVSLSLCVSLLNLVVIVGTAAASVANQSVCYLSGLWVKVLTDAVIVLSALIYMELQRVVCQKCALQSLPTLVAVISVQHHMVICWCLEREREPRSFAVSGLCMSGMTCHWPCIHHPARTLRQFQSTRRTILYGSTYATWFDAYVTVLTVRIIARYIFTYLLTYLLT